MKSSPHPFEIKFPFFIRFLYNNILNIKINRKQRVMTKILIFKNKETGIKLITIEDVEHVAKLARLELNNEEKQKYATQLGAILEYVDQLNEVNTEGVEPMAHAFPISNVMREDVAKFDFTRDEMLKNAPEEEDGFFKVHKIGS